MILLVMAVALALSLSLARSNVYAAAENPTEAESLTFGKDVAGTFPAYPDEVFNYHYHYYKFKTTSYGGVDYTLRAAFTEGGGGNPGFSIYLLNEDYKQIDEEGAENSHFIILSGVGTANSETYKNLKPNTTYYIEVESWYTNNDYTSSYSLRVSKKILKPAAPKLKSVKPGKKKFTVKYSKTKNTGQVTVTIKKVKKNKDAISVLKGKTITYEIIPITVSDNNMKPTVKNGQVKSVKVLTGDKYKKVSKKMWSQNGNILNFNGNYTGSVSLNNL